MPDSIAHLIPLAIGVLSFVAIALVADVALIWWRTRSSPGARRVRRRIDRVSRQEALSAQANQNDGIERRTPLSQSGWLSELLRKLPAIEHLEHLIEQSGLKWNVATLLGLMFAALLTVGTLSGLLGQDIVVVALLGAIAALLPYAFVSHKRAERLKRFESQLPDALDVIGRAMLSGYSLAGALKVVGEELPDPIGSEFGQAHDEITFGINVRDALEHLTDRMPSVDLRYMVIAILIQRETGGNLAEIFGKISNLMRERQKLSGQIKVLSAEGRMSAVVLGLLPFVMALILVVVNRSYVEILWRSPQGLQLLFIAALMMGVGILWIRRIIRIRF